MLSASIILKVLPDPIRVAVSRGGSGACELANQSRLDIWQGGVKETEAKTEHLRQWGNTELLHWTL